VALRAATAYGLSPLLRLGLMVNRFAKKAWFDRHIIASERRC